MLIAEELEVDLDQVRLEHAPPNEKLYGNPLLAGVQATGGSTSIPAARKPLREAAAAAPTPLVAAGGRGRPAPCGSRRGPSAGRSIPPAVTRRRARSAMPRRAAVWPMAR